MAEQSASSRFPLRPPTADTRSLILIGYRATGKSTVGRMLAQRLGWEFIDADDLVEATFGGTIAQVFAAEGEAGFRDREAAALLSACGTPQRVIATGGGAILRLDNRDLLRRTGFVTWLTADAETIWARLQADAETAKRRPNLTVAGGLAEVRTLLAAREPLYRETAHLVVPADHPSPEAVASAILKAWTGPFISPSHSPASASSSSA